MAGVACRRGCNMRNDRVFFHHPGVRRGISMATRTSGSGNQCMAGCTHGPSRWRGAGPCPYCSCPRTVARLARYAPDRNVGSRGQCHQGCPAGAGEALARGMASGATRGDAGMTHCPFGKVTNRTDVGRCRGMAYLTGERGRNVRCGFAQHDGRNRCSHLSAIMAACTSCRACSMAHCRIGRGKTGCAGMA